MSVFDKVLAKHNAEIEKEKQDAEMAALKRETDQRQFTDSFYEKIREVAKPIFDEFVDDARRSNYSANVKESIDGNGCPNICVQMNMVQGATAFKNYDSIFYTIRGNARAGMVEHIYCSDQRLGAAETKRKVFGIPSINENIIRGNLEELFSAALEARKRPF